MGAVRVHIGNRHQPLMITDQALVCPDMPRCRAAAPAAQDALHASDDAVHARRDRGRTSTDRGIRS
mgnify:CR=1 FL=1